MFDGGRVPIQSFVILYDLQSTPEHPSMARKDFSFKSARFRALIDLTKTLILPSVVLVSLLRATKVQLGYYTIPCYILSLFLGSYLQGLYRSFQLGRATKILAKGKKGTVGSIPVQVHCRPSFCRRSLSKHPTGLRESYQEVST